MPFVLEILFIVFMVLIPVLSWGNPGVRTAGFGLLYLSVWVLGLFMFFAREIASR